MEHNIRITDLASLAQIKLDAGEADALLVNLAPMFDLADTLSEAVASPDSPVSISTGSPVCVIADVSSPVSVAADDDSLAAVAVSISDLREDIPTQKIDPEIFFIQSPTSGDGGFTIHRLIE